MEAVESAATSDKKASAEAQLAAATAAVAKAAEWNAAHGTWNECRLTTKLMERLDQPLQLKQLDISVSGSSRVETGRQRPSVDIVSRRSLPTSRRPRRDGPGSYYIFSM